jgi:hypothetical protein
MPVQPELALFAPRPRRQEAVPALPPGQEESYLAALARQGGGFIETLGRALDTPGAIARGVLAGEPTSGFNWDYDKRVTGEELLEKYGLLNPAQNRWARTGAGLAAEIALDPLTMVSGPLRALGAGGKAARATGLLDKVSDVAMARIGFDDAARTMTGRATKKWAEGLAPKGIGATAETYSIRPLIGQRQAQATTTLDELVQFADKGKDTRDAYAAVSDYLANRGIRYEDVAGDKLGGAFGLGYFTPMATFTPPGSLPVLDAMDALGQRIAWSGPARYASQLFDVRVNDTYQAADQVEALKHSRLIEDAEKLGRRVAARHAMTVSDIKLSPAAQEALGAPSLMSQQGNDFLTRMFENTYTQADARLKNLIGKDLDRAIDSWDSIRKYNVKEGQRLGMAIEPYGDEYQVLYSPRRAAEADFSEYGEGLGRSSYNTRMLEQAAREKYLRLPGGTIDLREISLLPKVDHFSRNGDKSIYTLGEVAREIKEYVDNKYMTGRKDIRITPFDTFVPMFGDDGKPLMQNVLDEAGNPVMVAAKDEAGNAIIDKATGKPQMVPKQTKIKSTTEAISIQQAEKIASLMYRMDKKRPAGLSLFSEHPINAQSRNIVSQNVARATAKYVYDSVAEAAINANRSNLEGGFKKASVAMDEIARVTGLKMEGSAAAPVVQVNLAEAIAKRLGKNADEINLDDFSVPESVFNRLTKIQSFYSSPRAQSAAVEMLNKYTSLFKGFVLAWPARFTRDMYSNLFSIFFETNSIPDTLWGVSTAKQIIRGNMDSAIARLRELPMYAGIADDAMLRQRFIEDSAASGVLQSLASNDLLSASRMGDVSQLVPGSTPLRRRDAAWELMAGDWRKFFQIKGVQFPWQAQAAYETGNPILNASQKLSDFVDSSARLGGYLALLKQGLTPDMAAKRITAALVDYSSLTLTERNFFRGIFPWWAYNSRIGKYVVQHMASNPGGSYAQTIRALNTIQASDKETYVPTALRQSFALRIPDALKPYMGIPEDDPDTHFFRDFDLPGVDVLSLLSPQPTATGALRETMFNVLNQASPVIRSPIEFATNMDFFTRRPLDEAVTPLDRIYMRAFNTPLPMNSTARMAINLIPGLQRPISLVGGLMDNRRPLAQNAANQLFNTFTGVKEIGVDKEWELNDKIRANAANMQGWTRRYVTESVPKDFIPLLPTELQPGPAIERRLKKEVKELRMDKDERRKRLMEGVK